jgi:poly(A) polymerase
MVAADIVDRVIVGGASWSDLFAKHDFFHRYRYYLQVTASTGNPDLQIKWYATSCQGWYSYLEFINLCRAGTVESRIRQLVMKLEFVDSLTLAHPFIKGFEQVLYCLSEEEVRAVAQGDISGVVAKRKKEDIEGQPGASPVYSTTFYIGLAIEPKIRACLLRIFDLVSYTFFKPVLLVHVVWTYHTPRLTSPSWSRCGKSLTNPQWVSLYGTSRGFYQVFGNLDQWLISVPSSSALPDYVFDPGERQPKSGQKRVKVSF